MICSKELQEMQLLLVELVFDTCWLLNIYGHLLVSSSLLAYPIANMYVNISL